MTPHCYFLRINQNLDIGYLKLFLTTKYVDLAHIEQTSPFEGANEARLAAIDRGTRGGDSRDLMGKEERRRLKSSIWDEITYVVVQRMSNPVEGSGTTQGGESVGQFPFGRTGLHGISHEFTCRCTEHHSSRGEEGTCGSCGGTRERDERELEGQE